ncbi:carboxylesterase/lipase family protein [Halopseudomonas sp.]|uniref:carboxylesterase/lipase family protein n=1 Tax=Halopseudomonas sp. TaxID=2901191 RepID=UPI003566916E
MNRSSHPRAGFCRTGLAAAFFAITLTGCLSGGDSSSSPPAADPAPTGPATLSATVQQGEVRGVELGSGVLAFRGIRYGAAPVNELRFAAPQPASSWDEPQQLSTAFGSACPQEQSAFGEASTEEDCLFLNVYRPTEPGDYPVMVWIHGGAFIYGSGGPAYEPSRLAQEGVVVVTLNYRLGALGFLPHADLPGTNFGLQDQQLALQWVKNNVNAFDGDPDNVTIFGESAGGHSVLSQVVSPGAAGLFHKAIVQSGSYNGDQIPLDDTPFGAITIPGGQTLFGDPTVAKTPCKNDAGTALVTCLRSLSVQELLAAQPSNLIPVTNTTVLPASINATLASGNFNKVPVMMGSNRDEGSLFTLLALSENQALFQTEASYRTAVGQLLAEDPTLDAGAIADYYSAKQPDSPVKFINAYSAIGTDWRFTCPNNRQWGILDDQVDTYGYWFTDRAAPAPAGLQAPFPLGASHSFEIQYVLNSFSNMENRGATSAQLDLASQMTGYWANFAKYGENPAIGPNATNGAANAVNWPQLKADGSIIRLDTPTQSVVPVADFRATHECAYWQNPPRLVR